MESKATSNKGEKFVFPLELIPNNQESAVSVPKQLKQSPVSTVAEYPRNSGASLVPVDAGLDRPAMLDAVQPFEMDKAKPLDPNSFPNQSRIPTGQLLATIANFQHLLRGYHIVVKYNTIKKKLEIIVRGHSGSFDNHDNVLLAQINSIAALNGFPTGQIPSLLVAIGDRNLYNPVAAWIKSKPWDGLDRLQAFYDTLVERDDFSKALKEKLMYRWALSPVAAALMKSGFRCRGVLTLQGAQGIGKTAWVSSLVPDPVLRSHVVLLNHHLDGSNKDSITTAVSHWLVEIGELDGSFRKDIARLKGFITADTDKLRRPYGRLDSEYPRRTVFCATVNDANFLVDATGNSRWWTIPVTRINYQHNINMQQLFAQLSLDLENGAHWWLTQEDESELEQNNNMHRVVSAIRERIMNAVDLKPSIDTVVPAMRSLDVLQAIGISFPSNPQCRECAEVLRELYGDPKKINGKYMWRVVIRNRQPVSTNPVDDDDLY